MENKRGRIKDILSRQLSLFRISEKEQEKIQTSVNNFISKLKSKLDEKGIKASIFIGGSFAKGTLIKKEKYDIDIFLRFDKNLSEEEISKQTRQLKDIDGYDSIIVKGSRNYLNFVKGSIVFEVVPIIKIKEPKEARNVTDLSVFHVKYIIDCVKKNKKLVDEIILAKAFVHASGCYGAESYIKGFSGYGLELLVCHYKSFLNFVKAVSKMRERDKIVLDPMKHWKNKNEVLLNLNEAKLESPIVLVDPTYKERNALAALSSETLKKFRNYCIKFLKKPSEEFFVAKKIDEEKLKELARKRKAEFVKLIAKTNKQQGDIAGSKLLKFGKFLINRVEKWFEIYENEFRYSDKDFAYYYLVVKNKKEVVAEGPPVSLKIACKRFKKEHKKTYIKNKRIYAKISSRMRFKEFLTKFRTDNKNVINSMGITEVNLAKCI